MDIYKLRVCDLAAKLRSKITVLVNIEALNRNIASEFADLLSEKQSKNELFTAICPVGPLNYRYFIEEVKKRGLSCRNLRTINMDEYLDASKKRKFYYSTYEYRNELDQYLYDELKITSDDLYDQEGAYYKYLVNLHFYVKLEGIITQIHQAKGFPTN